MRSNARSRSNVPDVTSPRFYTRVLLLPGEHGEEAAKPSIRFIPVAISLLRALSRHGVVLSDFLHCDGRPRNC